MSNQMIYKILSQTDWDQAQRDGVFRGSGIDVTDGFIHFSSADQLDKTLELYFAGRTDLVILEVDAERLGDQLRWEPSRDGALFPHLYGDLPLDAATPKKIDDR